MGMGKSVTTIRDNAVSAAEGRQARFVDLIGKLNSVETYVAELAALAVEAYNSDDAKALGHESWQAYCRTLPPIKLSPPWRSMLIAELDAAGMSSRAIAPIAGVSRATVQKEVGALAPIGGIPAPEVVEVSSGKNLPVETGTTSPVTVGINGKTYQRKPRPARPADAVAEAVVDAVVVESATVKPGKAPKGRSVVPGSTCVNVYRGALPEMHLSDWRSLTLGFEMVGAPYLNIDPNVTVKNVRRAARDFEAAIPQIRKFYKDAERAANEYHNNNKNGND